MPHIQQGIIQCDKDTIFITKKQKNQKINRPKLIQLIVKVIRVEIVLAHYVI